MNYFYLTFVSGFLSLFLTVSQAQTVLTGLDQVEQYHSLFANKHLGIITNHTAFNSSGKHITNIFLEMPEIQVTALFGPEHGIRGKEDAGAKIGTVLDPLSGIPIYSLYGKTLKPTKEMLQNVDILVFDIQDIGSRFYTYIWTMALAMEAAAENGLPIVVLDRPNPLNGIDVEGNILDSRFSTFVGLYPIPVRHGMSVGELAQMFNGEGWLKNGIKAELTVIPIKNWQREQWFDQTGLKFIKPSPNMPNLETATVYPGICLLEGTNVSEGRGTLTPFLQFGAPWIDSKVLINALDSLQLPGVKFDTISFTPKSIPGMSGHPKLENQLCNGARIRVTNRMKFKSYLSGIRVVETLHNLYPKHFKWKISHFDRLCGTDHIRKTISRTAKLDSLFGNITEHENSFRILRKPYLLYH